MRWWLQGTLEVIPMYNMVIEERDIRLGVEELFEKDYFNLFDFNPQLHLNVTRQPKAEMQQFLVVFEFEGIQKWVYINSLHKLPTDLPKAVRI